MSVFQSKTTLKCAALSVMTVFILPGVALWVSGQTKKKPKYAVPQDTIIRVRMNDKLSSKGAQVGSTFTTTVVTPIYAKGVQVIPAGAVATGTVTHVNRASRKSGTGSLNVAFTSIKMPDGLTHPISASLATSACPDNEGQINGKSSKQRNATFIGRGVVVGGLINGPAGAATGGVIGAARGLIKKGEEAQVDQGTEFNIILNHHVSLTVFP